MTHAPHRWIGRWHQVIAGLLVMAWVLHGMSAGAVETTAWELLPYRIEVQLALAEAPQLTPRRVEDLRQSLVHRADASVGGHWDLSAQLATPQQTQLWLNRLSELQLADLPPEWETATADKIILVTMVPQDGAILVQAREYDVRTRLLGVPVEQRVLQAEQLQSQTFRAVLDAFAPLAQFATVESKAATLKLRAAHLPLRDPQLQFVASGDIWRAAVRVNDRFGNARRVEPVEWTLLQTESVAGGLMQCTIYSGMKNPFNARQKGRLEQLAVRIGTPKSQPTRLRLLARDRGTRPLPGYEIHAYSPGSTDLQLLGLTNARGEIQVPPAAESIRILVVKNGGGLLARLPLVPGLFPTMDAAIPDDDYRLEVEGFVTGLQESIVDWFAAREVLMAQIRVRMEKREFKEARQIMTRLRDLQKKQRFGQRLADQKRISTANDGRVQDRINKLFDDTQQVMNRYANPADIDTLEQQLATAERAATAPPPVAPPAAASGTTPPPAAGTTVAMP